MYITKITLYNFRNYIKQELNIDKNINILIGDNAQGKTNIIESIYLSSIGKSFRTNYEEEMINMANENASVSIEYIKNDKENELKIFMEKGKHKLVKINGIKLDKLSQVVGNIQVVIFSPDELQILKQSPSVRRRFFDISITQIKPVYIYDILQYNKVLKQRNTLLKQIKYNNSLIETMDVWNEKLISNGMKLIETRKAFIEKIKNKVAEKHQYISDCKEELRLEYNPNCTTKEEFIEKLKNTLDSDIQRGYTSAGPHKDDYIFYINSIDLSKYGSQGQQRSGILSYKLAEIDNLKEEYNENPILLLDDVTSELDSSRVEKLFSHINEYQTIITCTDIIGFNLNFKYNLYKVSNGIIEEVKD